MANHKHIERLKLGVDKWNGWRSEKPYKQPDFSGWDLSGQNLAGINLESAILTNSKLKGANLRGANLSKARLFQADLSDIDLTETNLRGAMMKSANLTNANLESLDLSGNYLESAHLIEANLRGTNLSKAILADAELHKAILENAILNEAGCNRASFIHANLRGADLRNAFLSNCILWNADLRSARIDKLRLEEADLTDANLEGQDFRSTWLVETDFERANLRRANFSNTRLWAANFYEAKLIEADFSKADLWVADLTGANLKKGNLQNASLRSARLIDAKLDGANLTGAHLWETQRAGWSIKGIICASVYWDKEKKEETTYTPGEFERLFADNLRIRLFYKGGITPLEIVTLPGLINYLENAHNGCSLNFQSIENTAGGAFVTLTIKETEDTPVEKLEAIKEAIQADAEQDIQSLRHALEGREKHVEQLVGQVEALKWTVKEMFGLVKPSMYLIGETTVGDKYDISGQAGAVGPNAHAHDMTFNQLVNHVEQTINLAELAKQLGELRQAIMQKQDPSPEAGLAIGNLTAAELAAKDKNPGKVVEHLKAAGKWTLEFAEKVGKDLVVDVIKKVTGLP